MELSTVIGAPMRKATSLLVFFFVLAGCAGPAARVLVRSHSGGVQEPDGATPAASDSKQGTKVGGKSDAQACFGIVNGREAPEHTFDYVLKLTSPNACTASLFSLTVLLTAAHCVSRDMATLTIDGVGEVTVAGVKTRGLFSDDAATLLEGKGNIGKDIALIKLTAAVTGRSTVKIAGSARPKISDKVTLAGFGQTMTTTASGIVKPVGLPSGKLMIGENTLFADLAPALILTAAKDDATQAVSAPGDSGGPLLWNGAIIGIAHKGSMNFAFGGLEAVVPTDADMLVRLATQPPQHIGVWVNFFDVDVRQFLNEAKAEGYEWNEMQTNEEALQGGDDEAPTACDKSDAASDEANSEAPVAQEDSVDTPSQTRDPDPSLVAAYVGAINDIRAHSALCGGEEMPAVDPLKWNSRLYAAALRHSTDLDAHGIAGHQGTDGSYPDVRVEDAGYQYANIGENQVSGATTLTQAFAAWMDSPAHGKGNMSSSYIEFGLAQVGVTWTLVFGRPK